MYVTLDGNPNTFMNAQTGVTEGLDPIFFFTAAMLSFSFLAVALFIAVRFIHGRPFKSLITANPAINLKRVLQGFALWFALASLVATIEALLHPGRYTFTLDLKLFIPTAIAAVILTPIQTSAEELLIRGYLVQATGLKIRNTIILSVISASVFMVLHFGNPEMGADALLMAVFYFSFGFFAAIITLRDNGLELALGVHAANNLFASLVANYVMSALPTSSIFMVNELDAVYGLASSLAAMIVFYLIIFIPWRKPQTVEEAIP
jgi:hypothetical protein